MIRLYKNSKIKEAHYISDFMRLLGRNNSIIQTEKLENGYYIFEYFEGDMNKLIPINEKQESKETSTLSEETLKENEILKEIVDLSDTIIRKMLENISYIDTDEFKKDERIRDNLAIKYESIQAFKKR